MSWVVTTVSFHPIPAVIGTRFFRNLFWRMSGDVLDLGRADHQVEEHGVETEESICSCGPLAVLRPCFMHIMDLR